MHGETKYIINGVKKYIFNFNTFFVYAQKSAALNKDFYIIYENEKKNIFDNIENIKPIFQFYIFFVLKYTLDGFSDKFYWQISSKFFASNSTDRLENAIISSRDFNQNFSTIFFTKRILLDHYLQIILYIFLPINCYFHFKCNFSFMLNFGILHLLKIYTQKIFEKLHITILWHKIIV